jgi:hypothetical protein
MERSLNDEDRPVAYWLLSANRVGNRFLTLVGGDKAVSTTWVPIGLGVALPCQLPPGLVTVAQQALMTSMLSAHSRM